MNAVGRLRARMTLICVGLSLICLGLTSCGGLNEEPSTEPERETVARQSEPLQLLCGSDSQCSDGHACTVDLCVAGACLHSPSLNCCESDDDCGEEPLCSTLTCVLNACVETANVGCGGTDDTATDDTVTDDTATDSTATDEAAPDAGADGGGTLACANEACDAGPSAIDAGQSAFDSGGIDETATAPSSDGVVDVVQDDSIDPSSAHDDAGSASSAADEDDSGAQGNSAEPTPSSKDDSAPSSDVVSAGDHQQDQQSQKPEQDDAEVRDSGSPVSVPAPNGVDVEKPSVDKPHDEGRSTPAERNALTDAGSEEPAVSGEMTGGACSMGRTSGKSELGTWCLLCLGVTLARRRK